MGIWWLTHPGLWGKIGHVAGLIGQTAGAAINPGIVENIPGTRLNRAAREAGESEALGKAEERETAAAAQEGVDQERQMKIKEAQAKLDREGNEEKSRNRSNW